jgi:hypothetical protein
MLDRVRCLQLDRFLAGRDVFGGALPFRKPLFYAVRFFFSIGFIGVSASISIKLLLFAADADVHAGSGGGGGGGGDGGGGGADGGGGDQSNCISSSLMQSGKSESKVSTPCE